MIKVDYVIVAMTFEAVGSGVLKKSKIRTET